jgi:hypothetical protein
MILFDADMSSKSSIFAFFGTLWSHFRTANHIADSVPEKKLSTFQILTEQIAPYSLLVSK